MLVFQTYSLCIVQKNFILSIYLFIKSTPRRRFSIAV